MDNLAWQVEELQKLLDLQPEKIGAALRSLWKLQPDLHKIIVINAYLCEKISLAKAAEELGSSRLELERELKLKGIPVRIIEREDVVAEVGAILEW